MKKTLHLSLILIFFLFTSVYSLAQFTDPSFGVGGAAGPFNNGFRPAGPGEKIQSSQSMTVDNNGRVLIVGHVNSGTSEDLAVMRLLPDGNPDQGFGSGGVVTFADLGGNGTSHEYGTVIAFNPSDNTITLAGYSQLVQNNSLVQGDVVVMQLHADGSINNNFGQGGVRIINDAVREEVHAIAFGNTGGANGIFIGGFTAPDFVNGNLERGHVWRLNNMGGSVTGFTLDFANARCHVFSLALDATGGILAGGDNEGGISRFAIARFNQNFAFDNSFDGDGKAFINVGNTPFGVTNISIQPDQKIIASGGFFDISSARNGTVVARLNTDGSVDNNFSGGFAIIPFNYTGSTASPRSTVLQSDGKIIVSGILNDAIGTSTNFGLARLNTDGSQDNNFGTTGFYNFDFGNSSLDFNNTLVLQADGKLLVGAMTRPSTNFSYSAGLIRLQFTQPVTCTISGLNSMCSGLTAIYDGPEGMDSYSWSAVGNVSLSAPINNKAVQVTAGSGSTSTFTLTLTVTKNGVSSSCSKIVNVTFETCQILGPSAICAGTTVFSGPANSTFYSW